MDYISMNEESQRILERLRSIIEQCAFLDYNNLESSVKNLISHKNELQKQLKFEPEWSRKYKYHNKYPYQSEEKSEAKRLRVKKFRDLFLNKKCAGALDDFFKSI